MLQNVCLRRDELVNRLTGDAVRKTTSAERFHNLYANGSQIAMFHKLNSMFLIAISTYRMYSSSAYGKLKTPIINGVVKETRCRIKFQKFYTFNHNINTTTIVDPLI